MHKSKWNGTAHLRYEQNQILEVADHQNKRDVSAK